jgi:hypothetical protein
MLCIQHMHHMHCSPRLHPTYVVGLVELGQQVALLYVVSLHLLLLIKAAGAA